MTAPVLDTLPAAALDYNADFYQWTRQQAALLRQGQLNRLDARNLAEKIESRGKSDHRAIGSHLANILSHLLKWRHQLQLKRIFTLAAVALLASVMTLAVRAAEPAISSEEHDFRVAVVTRGLEHPWGLAFLPDGRLLVTERPGRLRLAAADGTLDPRPVEGLPPIAAHGQGGLLDVALHPQFAENGLVYLSYAARGEGGVGTEAARGRLVDHRLEEVKVWLFGISRYLQVIDL